jgi:hypothetical protein
VPIPRQNKTPFGIEKPALQTDLFLKPSFHTFTRRAL